MINHYKPVRGDVIRLIDNDGTDAIAGTFAGWAEGASVQLQLPVSVSISYVGGTGNDVVLIVGNSAPTGIALSNTGVDENSAVGTIVGNLSATDPDASDTFTYTLIHNPNSLFGIDGNRLIVNGALDFEAGASHLVVVRAADQYGGTFNKVFEISIGNVNEAPAGIALSNASVGENSAAGTIVGNLVRAPIRMRPTA